MDGIRTTRDKERSHVLETRVEGQRIYRWNDADVKTGWQEARRRKSRDEIYGRTGTACKVRRCDRRGCRELVVAAANDL